MAPGRWAVTEAQYPDVETALYRSRDRPDEFTLKWQQPEDAEVEVEVEVEVLGDVRRVLGRASLERNWESYLRKRDENTRRGRKWADLQWRLAHRAWAKSPGLRSAAQRLTRHLWTLDLMCWRRPASGKRREATRKRRNARAGMSSQTGHTCCWTADTRRSTRSQSERRLRGRSPRWR